MRGTGGCTSGGYGSLARKKRGTIAAVAIARELAGWCWSLATLEDAMTS